MPAPSTAIRVRGLRKSYGRVDAVQGIDLDIAVGEVFALLGPNGAGKTTTVEVLEGHRTRSGGEVEVLGFDPADGDVELRRRIGIVLQDTGVERFLTVAEVIDQYRGYYPQPMPADRILDLVGLTDSAGKRVRRLSGGQRRRLDVAVGLAGDPELLFLDEPTTGFDPGARRNAWSMIRGLKELGKTVLLTTHYMDEAQQLADRVAVIAGGRIVAEGSPESLLGVDGTTATISFRLPARSRALPAALTKVFERDGSTWRASTTDVTGVVNKLTAWALKYEVDLENLEVKRPTLEDAYLALVASDPSGPPGERIAPRSERPTRADEESR